MAEIFEPKAIRIVSPRKEIILVRADEDISFMLKRRDSSVPRK